MILHLITGHNFKEPGAVAYNGRTEFDFNVQVGELAAKLEPSIIHHRTLQHALYALSMETRPCCSIELHFNAFNGEKVIRGSESLIISDGVRNLHFIHSKRMAIYFISNWHKFSGIKPRNYYKQVRSLQRGHGNLQKVAQACQELRCNMIFEPAFCDVNHSESRFLIMNPFRYAEFLVETWKGYLEE